MIDYKSNGKVICTQPRIAPTFGNSDWISQELGVPILQHSDLFGERVVTNNTFIQFKYQTKTRNLKS